MQISHVVLNYFFISYIIVELLFILQIGIEKKVVFLVFVFKIWTLSRERSWGSHEISKYFGSFLKSPGYKVSFNFLYFPHKAEFMSGSQEILMFNDSKCSSGMKFKFSFDIPSCFTIVQCFIFHSCFIFSRHWSLYCQLREIILFK